MSDYVVIAEGNFPGRTRVETITLQTSPMNALIEFMKRWDDPDGTAKAEIKNIMINNVGG